MSYIFPERYYYGIAYANGLPVLLRRFRTAKLRNLWVAKAVNHSIVDGHDFRVRRARNRPDGLEGWVDDGLVLP